ncbi:MAG TPA: hypothetical protein VHB98_14160 [Chloroflexota bacterium]|nr:hypothetical protein [Chloroflexota bacterium]
MTTDIAPAPADLDLWQQVTDSYNGYIAARKRLFQQGPARVALVRAGLRNPAQRGAALDVAALLPAEEVQQVLEELLALASTVHGFTEAARAIILRLPQDWLCANIPSYAEAILAHDDYEEYRGLLALYAAIDRTLAEQLAHRAAVHADSDIREAGNDFLQQDARRDEVQAHIDSGHR